MSLASGVALLLLALLAGQLRWLAAVGGLSAEVSDSRRRVAALRAYQRDWQLLAEGREQVALVQGVAEQLISEGAMATREVHQKIADVPFSVLENIPATRDAARLARGVHDVTATGVYAAISALNKESGKGLRQLFGVADSSASAGENVAKPRQPAAQQSAGSPDDAATEAKPGNTKA